MATAPRGPRVIPNFAMDRPWSDPQTEEELDGLAQTALLSGAPATNQGISRLLARFAGDYVANLGKATG